jgi:glycosyltransferase involved in cell wall biosynthesis
VSSDDLGALYAGATAVVFPSRYEGFGLPVLEAMRLGCPVIAANTTALPSVVGGAGILVPPDDVDEWVRAMVLMCDDPVERRRHVAAGRERAAGFTWESSARALVGVWRRAATAAGVGPDVNEGRT